MSYMLEKTIRAVVGHDEEQMRRFCNKSFIVQFTNLDRTITLVIRKDKARIYTQI